MVLRAGYIALAQKLQEAADEGDSLGSNAIRSRLQDAIGDAHRGTGSWASYMDHFGDGESGDVIYSKDGDTKRAPYTMGSTAGKAPTCNIDTANEESVVPRIMYETEGDDADGYAAMAEAFKVEKLYDAVPLYERFVSKGERDKAGAEDFAGKGKSFPILKPEDVAAAAHSIGRAGSGNLGPSGLKARIIAIAKRKGWTSYLPKAWQGGDSTGTSESVKTVKGGLKLVESAVTMETIKLTEARADYEIKLIAPGKGSSAFYPSEVLKRDGPKVFKAGTHVYVNHPTLAEEAQRPEGDVKNLAGVLTTQAVYHENHAKGEGLYARMKVFADHGQMVEEKAAHVGMSIRASGMAESGKQREGLPILKELTSAESVDVVTRAGAGGMILTEAANGATNLNLEVSDMDANELKMLKESVDAQAATNKRLLERAVRGDARELATKILAPITLDEKAKQRVIESCLRDLPLKDGELDTAKFTEAVNAEAKTEGAYVSHFSEAGKVRGMGSASTVTATEAALKPEEINARAVKIFERLGHSPEAAKRCVNGRVA